MHWLHYGSRLSRPRLNVLYTLFGKPPPKEKSSTMYPATAEADLCAWGNEARVQHQLDVYGMSRRRRVASDPLRTQTHGETWRAIKSMADLVADRWEEPDSGIWEVRGE
jgi:hypothetical protein